MRPTQDAGLEIVRWEADALARFAPFVSSAPHRLIRFTNVYRLIRTSLPRDVMKRSRRGPSGA
jgi:hypothetical protein